MTSDNGEFPRMEAISAQEAESIAHQRAIRVSLMAEHPGLPVPDYAPTQSADAVAMVSEMKRLEEEILRRLDDLAGVGYLGGAKHELRPDLRWLAIGRTAIEQGFSAVNRSIFKPGRVALPGDIGTP